jgi:all-trans-retinol 13,14-reductase
MKVSSYKQAKVDEVFDSIVIGSGMGGMTVAALLARHAGQRVLVLERHYTPGGFTHTFRRPEYEWDVGVHYIGRVATPESSERAAFDYLSEGRLRWQPMPDVYDRLLLGGREYEFLTGAARFRASLQERFPAETRAIDAYFRAVRSAARKSGAYFASKALPRPVERLVGGLMRAPFLRYSDRTTREVLNSLGCSAELVGVLTGQWGDYGLPPGQSSFAVHAMIAEHYLEGAAYPVGGASSIFFSLLPSIERAGGRVLVSADVQEVVLDERGRAVGVRMPDGRQLRAAHVISDAGAANTYLRLLPGGLAQRLGVARKLDQVPASMSHISLYVGLKHTAEELGLRGGNLWVCPGPDHDLNVARSEASPDQPLPVLFISFPSAKDPTFTNRFPGRATIEVVAPAPYAWFEKWVDTRWKRRGADYDELKGRLAERLKLNLERYVPEVRGKIDYCELSTPLTTRHFANYGRGEIYGLAPVPARFRLDCLGPRTPVPGLYLTGADVTMCGVTGALFGGVVTASNILGRNLMSVVARPSARGAKTEQRAA